MEKIQGSPRSSSPLCAARPKRGDSDVLLARKVGAVVQHHNSITGTSKPEVTTDLDARLTAAIAASTFCVYGKLREKFTAQHAKLVKGLSLPVCGLGTRVSGDASALLSNATPGSAAQQADTNGLITVNPGDTVAVWNGMLQKRVEAVTFLVNSDEKLSITDASTGNSVQAQLIPPVPVPFDLGTADVRPDQQWSIVAMVTIPPLTKSVLRFSASNGTTTTSSSWSCVNASAAAVHRDELTISGNGVELS